MAVSADPDLPWMRRALALARRGEGATSPNPMVGAVLVRNDVMLGEGWHHRAGLPHAEIEALTHARQRGGDPAGATLFVTLEPCCTHGRTPPCTDAILRAGIRRVVVAADDPNPKHAGRGLDLLRAAGIQVKTGLCAGEAAWMNRAFNHWIVTRRPWVTLKAAMTLDGKIATATGESKWITGEPARRAGMRMRAAADAVLAGVGTVAADNPHLTIRRPKTGITAKLRIILDPRARTPAKSHVLQDAFAAQTLLVITSQAPPRRVRALEGRARVLVAPAGTGGIDLVWLLDRLGGEGVTHVMVEGGGVTHAHFLENRTANAVAFFYAPMVLGGERAPRAVAGRGWSSLAAAPRLAGGRWRKLGADLLLEAEVRYPDLGAVAP